MYEHGVTSASYEKCYYTRITHNPVVTPFLVKVIQQHSHNHKQKKFK
jgi:hypothetical protein